MLFTTWLQTWLSRHPLKEPSGVECARFTDEIMARVKALGLTSKEALAAVLFHRWIPWPRFALAIATATATIVLVVGVVNHSNRQLAKEIVEPHPTPSSLGVGWPDGGVGDARLLAALEEPGADLEAGNEADLLAEELQMADALVLAEATPSDDAQWIQHTLDLLDQIDEAPPSDAAAEGSAEDWLDELEALDEHDLSSAS